MNLLQWLRLKIKLVGNLSLVGVLCTFFSLMGTFAQNTTFHYAIKQHDVEIGNLRFSRTTQEGKTLLTLESSVDPRNALAPQVYAVEHTTLINEYVTYSSVHRRINNKVKLDKKTSLVDGRYVVHGGKQPDTLQFDRITYNMLCLYAFEPWDVTVVYSDILQDLLQIECISDGRYRIRFPDGNFNEYFYVNGVCTRISVHNLLYNATIELRSDLRS